LLHEERPKTVSGVTFSGRPSSRTPYWKNSSRSSRTMTTAAPGTFHSLTASSSSPSTLCLSIPCPRTGTGQSDAASSARTGKEVEEQERMEDSFAAMPRDGDEQKRLATLRSQAWEGS